MNLVFIDAIDWDYDIETPYERPLGGSQSALCYLAAALADRGHAVTVYCGTTKPRVVRKVSCASYSGIRRDAFSQADAAIVLNGPANFCHALRPHIPRRCRLLLWTQHAHDQPAMRGLQLPDIQAAWDVIVCVSQWHALAMQKQFGLDGGRMAVMRNAIGPAFGNLFPDAAALAQAKSLAPVLAYTSTPFRGLDVLLRHFPELHGVDPRVILRVYSSMKVYGQEESADHYAPLYQQSRTTAGVQYIGSIPQPALAESLKSSVILSYPNTFPETSCIAVMEAMAAGLLVVTSDLGALPETTMGRGTLVPGSRGQQDLPRFAQAFFDQMIVALRQIMLEPRQFWAARWEQVRTVTSQCTWTARAIEWERFLGAFPRL